MTTSLNQPLQLNSEGNLKHFLTINGLSKKLLTEILDTADSFIEVGERNIKNVPLLRGKTVVNLFFESSTRTRSTFELAARRLSADVLNLDISTSSTSKGETLSDTLQNLAGDGRHAHPTQAMLDMLTIRQFKKRFEGLRVAIVGDILHSRVARSQIRALKTLDVIIMLRLQKERMAGALLPSEQEFYRLFGLTNEKLKLAKEDALVMHPGPINRGVEIESAVADGPQSVILTQVTNGIAVRMAVMSMAMSGMARGKQVERKEGRQ